jgi:protease I
MKKIIILLLAIILTATATGCGRASGKEITTPAPTPTPIPTSTPTPLPTEPTIALIVANQNFNYNEYTECQALFMLGGYESITVAPQSGTAVSTDSQTAAVDSVISTLNADAVDALVVIGGSGVNALYEDTDLKTLIQAVYAAGKPVGAICLGPVTLAKAGLLSGKQATVYPDETAITALETAGATYIDDSHVVKDGAIVTANDSDAVDDFAITILHLIDNTVTTPKTP